MYDIYAYLELVREYFTMRKPFCANGVGLLMYRTSSAGLSGWLASRLWCRRAWPALHTDRPCSCSGRWAPWSVASPWRRPSSTVAASSSWVWDSWISEHLGPFPLELRVLLVLPPVLGQSEWGALCPCPGPCPMHWVDHSVFKTQIFQLGPFQDF